MMKSNPRKMYSVPSVTTIAGTFPTVTSRPLTTPKPAPSATPKSTISGIARSGEPRIVSAQTNAVNPTIEPTERSMFRVRTTSVWPTATIERSETDSRISSMFPGRRKRGSWMATTRTSKPRASAMPTSRTRPTMSSRRAVRGRGRSSTCSEAATVSVMGHRLAGRGAHDRLLVGLVARELAGEASLVHDQHAVRHREHLRQLARDQQDRQPPGRQAGDDAVPLALRPDVDPAGRLAEDQDLRVGREPLRDHDLLLVAARERADGDLQAGGPDLEPVREVGGDLALTPAIDEPEAREPPQERQRGVVLDRHLEHEALVLAVLGNEGEAGLHRCARRPDPHGGAVAPDLAGVEPIDAEDRARHLGAPGADEAGQADDLAAPEGERDVAKDTLAREPADLERRLADHRRLLREELPEVPAHHVADQSAGIELGRRSRDDMGAVAQHRDRVREGEDLLEPVRDEEDGHAALPEVLDDAEQLLGLARGEGRGGLVHDHHARVHRQCLGDLHQLLVGDGQALHRRAGIERDAELAHELSHLAIHLLPRDAARAVERLAPHEHVFRHVEVGEQRRLLVDHGDAAPASVARSVQLHVLAGDHDHAGVRLVNAAEDPHERALPGAVLADERVDLAGGEGEIDASEGVDAAEGLGHAPQLHDRGGRDRHQTSSMSTPAVARSSRCLGVAPAMSTFSTLLISVIALSPARSNFEPSSMRMALRERASIRRFTSASRGSASVSTPPGPTPLTLNSALSAKCRSIASTVDGPTKDRVALRREPDKPISSACGSSVRDNSSITGTELVSTVTRTPDVSRLRTAKYAVVELSTNTASPSLTNLRAASPRRSLLACDCVRRLANESS